MLYLEIFYNLVMCRHGQGGRPPVLFVTRKEWDRPSSPDVLAQLLPIPDMTIVASPYLLLDHYEWVFKQHWTELVPVRWGGHDIVILGQLGDFFAQAERTLRRHLYSQKGQGEIGEALAQALPKPATNGLRDRAMNTVHATPKSWHLAALGLWAIGAAWWLVDFVRPLVRRTEKR